MSGINWSEFVMNNEPELKVFGSKNMNTSETNFHRPPQTSFSFNGKGDNYRSHTNSFSFNGKGDNYRSQPSSFSFNRPQPASFFYGKDDNYRSHRNSFSFNGRSDNRSQTSSFGFGDTVPQQSFGSESKANKDYIAESYEDFVAMFPEHKENIVDNNPKETPKKITNALLKLDKVSNTINGFMEDFLSSSGIMNNTEYLDLWKSSGNQEKLFAYIKQKKIKMKETIEERNAKKMEKKIKRETKLKEIHQKRMVKQQSKPKTAFYYFKEDETVKLKLEHPTWNRKEVHAELQKKWKAIKNTDEARPYREKTKSTEDTSA